MQKPKLICLTPVRNEAWILDAFLQATSLWADHIIIADQNSTDGSLEIYKKYPKVIVVDNSGYDLHETNRSRLMLEAGRKIEGNKVFITLDADEFFTGNFMQTTDWQSVKNAAYGDDFTFQWAILDADEKHYEHNQGWSDWGFFDDGSMPPESATIHVCRIPWPADSSYRKHHFIKDFQVMHFAHLYPERTKSKLRFYQCFILQDETQKVHWIRLFRGYFEIPALEDEKPIPDYFFDYYKQNGIDLLGLLNRNEKYFWQDERITEYFDTKGIRYFRKLDIFDKKYLQTLSEISGKTYTDPRTWWIKLLHFYLRKTQKHKNTKVIKVIDKVLRTVF